MNATTILLALALGAQKQTSSFTPSNTTVLIVPTVNASGDKYKGMKVRQDEESDKTLHRLFASRGFSVIPAEKCSPEVAEARADGTPFENQQDHLFALGREAGAQIVVFTEIDRTWQRGMHVLVVPTLAGYTSFKTWILDVPNHKAILSGSEFQGRSTAIVESGSERQTRAVRIGLESQLKPLLDHFAKVDRLISESIN